MEKIEKPAVLIAGPTAGGKSSVAMLLAEKWNGVIINADSMQVYREMQILSARPGADDMAKVPHRLYGHVAMAEAYSSGRWLDDIAPVLADVWGRGQLPVITGGSGLYFKMLLEGVAAIPDIAEDIRAFWRGKAQNDGPEVLHKILGTRDAAMAARLEPGDTQRLVRALEVLEGTGRSLHEWQKDKPSAPLLDEAQCMRFVIAPPRGVLYERINARFDRMMASGALDEARAIKKLGLAANLPAMKALGVKQLLAHIDGDVPLEEVVEQAKMMSRRYAKRQMTWLRSNMIAWNWVLEQESKSQLAKIFSFVQ